MNVCMSCCLRRACGARRTVLISDTISCCSLSRFLYKTHQTRHTYTQHCCGVNVVSPAYLFSKSMQLRFHSRHQHSPCDTSPSSSGTPNDWQVPKQLANYTSAPLRSQRLHPIASRCRSTTGVATVFQQLLVLPTAVAAARATIRDSSHG